MNAKKTKKSHETVTDKACHVPGCKEPGAYKAPASRDAVHQYHWYCLDHVREYNKQWDFFAGLDANEIEAFRKDAVTGHRPTWTRENPALKIDQLNDALHRFMHGAQAKAKPAPGLPAKLRNALALLELDYPYTEKTLKIHYRQMVKRYHPDMNKGDKESEEQFKKITVAYKALVAHLA